MARVIGLESKVKIAEKENEVLGVRAKEQEEEIGRLQASVDGLRGQLSQKEREWEVRHEDEVEGLRNRLLEEKEREIKEKEAENGHLRHKVKDYEKKYAAIIPKVEKLKKMAGERGEQVEQLQ